jgi:hypothetical protein
MKPQNYIINTVRILLEKSHYGQDIYAANRKCLQSSTKLISDLFQK